MQLKKKLAVSAVTAAMLVASMPAFASDGLHLGAATRLSLAVDLKGLLKDIKKEIRVAVKADKKSEKKEARDERATTRSASATPVVSCRTSADHAQRDAIKKAQVERDNEARAAREAFLAALLSARNTYRADLAASASATVTVSASTTPVSAKLQARSAARTRYQKAVKAAEAAFAAAKRKTAGDYRSAVQDANDTYHRARLSCRVTQ